MNSTTESNLFAVFPGQGSQHVGMGKDLYENFALARAVFEEASDAIHVDLKKLCFDGPTSDLTLTENTQPCLLATSVAAFRVAERELNLIPGAVAGHSLGEYSALVAIGSLELSLATRWVKERGRAMQQAVPAGEGGMAAVLGLEDSLVEKLCHQATQIASKKREQGEKAQQLVPAVVQPANFNSPGQVVIAGSTDAVYEALTLIKEGGDSKEYAGGKAISLPVSAPFHCKLMAPARDRMANLFSLTNGSEKPRSLKCPYVPNRTARLSQEPGIILELLIEQIDHPVLWNQSIRALLESRFSIAIEFGPGKVLSGLIKRISQSTGQSCSTFAMSDSASLTALHKNLEEIRKTKNNQ